MTETEVIALLHLLAANSERMSGELTKLGRVLARDVLQVAALARARDALEAKVITDCHRRAEKVLLSLGDDEHAN